MFHTLLPTVSSSLRSSNLFEATTTYRIAKTKRKKATFVTGGSNPWFATVTHMSRCTKFGHFKALTALLKKPSLVNEALLFLNWNVQRKPNQEQQQTEAVCMAWTQSTVTDTQCIKTRYKSFFSFRLEGYKQSFLLFFFFFLVSLSPQCNLCLYLTKHSA